MSVVAAAIVGGAVVTAYSSSKASEEAGEASQAGADAAAQAQIESTRMQIEEMGRQFDYQQSVLQPQIQQQFNAQRAYSDLLGIGGPQYDPTPIDTIAGTGAAAPGPAPIPKPVIPPFVAPTLGSMGSVTGKRTPAEQLAKQTKRARDDWKENKRRLESDYERAVEAQAAAPVSTPSPAPAQFPGSSPFTDRSGAFVDPNLNPTQLADIETLSGTVQANLLAGTTAEDDPYRNYLTGTSLDAGSLEGDMVRRDIGSRSLAEGAAGTGVYGDVFQESPGYAFQREEMERQLERVGSAGGPNIGGRAIIEGQRRAQGLAAGDYYNWAQGRERDLVRRGGAEATDIGRLDQTAYNYQGTQQREQARGDQGYQDYLRRREGDVSRIDAAAGGVDRLQAADLERQDQGYYNYLNAVASQAGFGGGPAAQAVRGSQQQGANVAGAYRSQGNALSLIANQQGTNQANINIGEYAGYNNAIQGGLSNYMTYQNMGQPPPTPIPPAAAGYGQANWASP